MNAEQPEDECRELATDVARNICYLLQRRQISTQLAPVILTLAAENIRLTESCKIFEKEN